MAETTPACDYGWKAPDFVLMGTDGRAYGLTDISGPKGTLIMFICNHCPFVKGVIDRIVTDANILNDYGIGVAAICSNDAASHPQDSFENMGEFAHANHFTFPYLHDETQRTARDYGAVCTPDFFGFNANLALQYRGRLDSAGKKPADQDTVRELLGAMKQIAETGKGPAEQMPSMGCSIKWRAG